MIALYLVSGCASPAHGLLAMRLTARHLLAYHNAPVPVARFHHFPDSTIADDDLPLVFDHTDLPVGLPEDGMSAGVARAQTFAKAWSRASCDFSFAVAMCRL